jgi:hypothetical protein
MRAACVCLTRDARFDERCALCLCVVLFHVVRLCVVVMRGAVCCGVCLGAALLLFDCGVWRVVFVGVDAWLLCLPFVSVRCFDVYVDLCDSLCIGVLCFVVCARCCLVRMLRSFAFV